MQTKIIMVYQVILNKIFNKKQILNLLKYL